MTDYYVRSTTGSALNTGTSWAQAKGQIGSVTSLMVAGDSCWISQAHSESTLNSTISPASGNGTVLSPLRFMCVDDSSGEPPTVVSTTATISTTGTGPISINVGGATYYGIKFNAGSGSGNSTITLGSSGTQVRMLFDTCGFFINTTGTSTTINLQQCTLLNCTYSFSGSSQQFGVATGITHVIGGSFLIGGSSPTSAGLFGLSTGAHLIVEGLDMTNISGSTSLTNPISSTSAFYALFKDCKLPGAVSWTGGLCFTTVMHPEAVVEMVNCAIGATNFGYWRQTLMGSFRHETTIVRTGGASDGVTPLSWKMSSSASMKYPNTDLASTDLYVWNDTTGSPKTATVEVVTDNVTLNDDEIWLELLYLGTSSFPLASRLTNMKASYLATPAAQPTSTAAWTTTGLATPVKQKLQVTFTPRMKGFVIGRVHLGKPSTIAYVDPKMVVA